LTELEGLKDFSSKISRIKKYDKTLLSHTLKIMVIIIILYNSAPQNSTIDRALDANREITVLLIGILTLLNPIRC
jgi:hypothetical protein